MPRITALVLLFLSAAVHAESTLIENVRIFDGVSDKLTAGHVLIVDGIIDTISGDPIEAGDHVTVIDGGNRVLIPGIIDAHSHVAIPLGACCRRALLTCILI